MLTVTELGKKLKISNRQIYRMCHNRELPYVKLGYKVLRFDEAEVDKYIKSLTIKPKP